MPLPMLVGAAASIATEFAPSLIRMFAGERAGEVADKVVRIARDVTGTTDDNAALDALRADPKAALAFKEKAASLEVELERAFLADRQDARARDVALRQLGQANYRADIMLFLAVGGLLAIIYFTWSARLDLPDHIFALFNMAAGALLKMIGDAFQFEFGSSRGSKNKDVIQSTLRQNSDK